MQDGEDDHRYTIRVTLIKQGRTKYWDFHCMYCGTKVCELSGDLVYAADVTPNEDGHTTRHRCNGKYCKLWYEFILA